MKLAVQRSFEVAASPQDAWARLSKVERWPEWAPHIRRVSVTPPGPLGPSSTGVLTIRGLGRNSFEMSEWDPPHRWTWIGGLPGVRIEYDHQFAAVGDNNTTLTWVVVLRGPFASLIRPVFARIYGGNVDRAIPRLQEWIKTRPT